MAIECLYKEKCKDYPRLCSLCGHSENRSYYTPIQTSYEPYIPQYPYYPITIEPYIPQYPYYPITIRYN